MHGRYNCFTNKRHTHYKRNFHTDIKNLEFSYQINEINPRQQNCRCPNLPLPQYRTEAFCSKHRHKLKYDNIGTSIQFCRRLINVTGCLIELMSMKNSIRMMSATRLNAAAQEITLKSIQLNYRANYSCSMLRYLTDDYSSCYAHNNNQLTT